MKCARTGKVRHASKRTAVALWKKFNNAALNVYYCPSCRGWHLGTSRGEARTQARIDQLLGVVRHTHKHANLRPVRGALVAREN